MAKKTAVVEIKANASDATKQFNDLGNSVKSLKDQVKEAQREAQELAAKFGITSKEATEAQKRLTGLKEELNDFNERVKQLDPGNKFATIGTAINQLAGGFAAAQGAAALLGSESEDLQKTLVKLQGALAISQGVDQLKDIGKTFSSLKVVAVDALNGIKAAFMSNPFFAVGAVVIGGLITAFALLSSSTDEYTEALERNNKETEEAIELNNKKFSIIERGLDREIALTKASGKETIELEQQKLQAVINRVKEEIRLLTLKRDFEVTAAKEEYDRLKQGNAFEQAKALQMLSNLEEYQKKYKEQSDAIQKLDDELFKTQTALDASKVEEQTKNTDKYLQELEKRRQKQRELDKKINEEAAKELDDITSKQVKVAEATIKTLNDVTTIGIQPFVDDTLSAFEIMNAKIKQSVDDLADALNGKFGKIQGFAVDTVQQNLQTVQGLMDAAMQRQLNAVGDNEAKQEQIRKTFFERQKKMQIAQGLISTYEGAVNAFKSTAASPVTVLFPAAPYIAAASAVAAGLANVANIRAQQYQGGSPGSSAVQAPSFGGSLPEFANQPSLPQTQGINQQQADTAGQQLVKVYVSQGEIQQANNNNSSIIEKATVQ